MLLDTFAVLLERRRTLLRSSCWEVTFVTTEH